MSERERERERVRERGLTDNWLILWLGGTNLELTLIRFLMLLAGIALVSWMKLFNETT